MTATRQQPTHRAAASAAWPGLLRFLTDSPGKLRSLTPYRAFKKAERRDLIGALMLFNVSALSRGAVDGISLLAAEGLLAALMAEPQRIAGQELLDFVANVETLAADFDVDSRSRS